MKKETKNEAREVWEREYEKIQDSVRQDLRNHFRPEFLNRIDDIVLFKNLRRDQIQHIVDIQLKELRKRLSERSMSLELSNKVKEMLAEKGYDPVFGARPLKRAIQKYMQDPLSMKILQGDFHDGDKIEVNLNDQNDSLIFKKRFA